jgi:isopentenyl phosphate kinase
MALLSLATETNLNDNGLSAVVLAPFSFVLLKNERIFTFPLETITTALDAGLVPVLHGDVCFDIEKGASILSGDTIVAFLAEHLNASQILLGTDVDGIYTANPIDNPNAKLIYEIDETNFQELLERVGPSSSTDVTGGMHRKLEELIALTQHNQIEVIIFNMCTPNRLKDLLAGRATTCTRMHPIMK